MTRTLKEIARTFLFVLIVVLGLIGMANTAKFVKADVPFGQNPGIRATDQATAQPSAQASVAQVVDFRGVYTGQLQGKNVKLTLLQTGSRIHGQFNDAATVFVVDGHATAGNVAGSLRHITSDAVLRFQASLSQDSLNLSVLAGNRSIAMTLTRPTRQQPQVHQTQTQAQTQQTQQVSNQPHNASGNPLNTSQFAGSYAGTLQGQRATLTIQQNGQTLSGRFAVASARYVVAGHLNGSQAQGTMRHDQTGFTVGFNASVNGQGLNFTLILKDPKTGQISRPTLPLTRVAAQAHTTQPAVHTRQPAQQTTQQTYPTQPQSSPLTGQWQGQLQGNPVAMVLQQNGQQVTGQLKLTGMFQLSAQIQGGTIQGTLSHAESRSSLPFVAQMQGRSMNLTLIVRDNQGQQQRVPIVFNRVGQAQSQATYPQQQTQQQTQYPTQQQNTQQASQLDRRIAGNWRITISRKVLNNNHVSDTQMVLNANGSYLYGAGSFAFAQGSYGGQTNGSNIERGRWNTADGVLYYQTGNNPQWQVWGRYQLDGSGRYMAIYLTNGTKVLCER